MKSKAIISEGEKMKTVSQTNLFDTTTSESSVKLKYSVQKYKLSYFKENVSLDNSLIISQNDVLDFCKKHLSSVPLENVIILALDNGNRIIGYDCVEGATNQCALYPANVFRFLLSAAASSFIIAHNHPGGSLNASEADWSITERLKEAGKLLEVPLLDHLIITENSHVSLQNSHRWNSERNS
jgi:DNA repair protein RadC